MSEFKHKIAVITGAANGIGYALAQRCVKEEMRVIIADIDPIALEEASKRLQEFGGDVVSIKANVANAEEVNFLAKEVFGKFGIPHLLFNNAGVGGTAEPIWEMSIKRLQWVLDVNVLSLMHSIHAFVPTMLASKKPCHIINTASVAGFYTSPFFASYQISKHSAVVLSECLYHDLAQANSNISISVLCPAWVKTKILSSARNYPEIASQEFSVENYNEIGIHWLRNFSRQVKKGISPEQVAAVAFEGIRKKKFYIFTHPEFETVMKRRMNAILKQDKPVQLEF